MYTHLWLVVPDFRLMKSFPVNIAYRKSNDKNMMWND